MTTTTTHTPAETTTTTTLDDETRRVLATAKGILANGWCQGNYQRGDHYCVIGAVRAAHGEPTACNSGHSYRVGRVVNILNRMAGQPVHHWNDDPDRTQQDVIDLIDQALQQ